MENKPIKDRKSFFSEWLEKLQQESWQLELLISGFALLGIWQSRGFIQNIENYLKINSTGIFEDAVNVLGLGLSLIWIIFMTNLLLHILCRGIWIGAIGLRYVSGDIDFDKLNYSPIFTKYLKRRIGSFDDYIEKMEKLCSVLFAYTFLLFFIFLSFLLFIAETGFILNMITNMNLGQEKEIILVVLFIFGIMIIGIIIFIDFITLGALKKIKISFVSKFYFFIYRISSILLLSFLYRPLLYNFIDQKYTRRLFLLAIPYAIAIFFIPNFFFQNIPYFPSFSSSKAYHEFVSQNAVISDYYEDLRKEMNESKEKWEKDPIGFASLSSSEIKGAFGSIFLRLTKNDNKLIEEMYPEFVPFMKEGLRHVVFNNDFKNEYLDSLSELQRQKQLEFRKELKKKQKEIKLLGDSSMIKSKIFDPNYRTDSLENIRMFYTDLRNDYRKKLVSEVKNAFLDLYEVQLDSSDYNDQLDCSYFVHPNLGEKGMICYFKVQELETGKHMFTIRKKNKNGNWKNRVNIPFWVIPED